MNNINKDYFMKYLKNELTDDETRQLVAWLRENKETPDSLYSHATPFFRECREIK